MIKFFCMLSMLLFIAIQNIFSQPGWIQQTSPVNADLVSVSFADENTGYACGGNYIIKTTNGGASWFVFDSTLAASGKVKIQFININTGFVSCSNYELYKTTNAGINWSLSASTDSRFGMVDNTYGWIFTYQQMFLTNDCGNTWSPGGIYPMTNAPASGGALGSRNFGIAVGWLNDFMHTRVYMYIWKSLNGGGSWVCVSGGVFEDACAFARIDWASTPAFNKAYVVDDYTAILYGGFQNYITHSSGAGWGAVNMGSTLGFDFINNTTGYSVGGNGSIQYTTSSGDSWIQQTTPVTAQLNSIDAINDTTGWAVGNSGTILKMSTGGIILPLPPILNSPANNSTGIQLTPLLDWYDIIQPFNYRIQISTDAGFSNLLVDNNTLTISQYDVPSGLLTYNTVYYWRAAAKNGSGWGPFSETWNFRTFNFPAQVILFSPPNNSIEQPTSLTFSWLKAVETLSKGNTKLNFEQNPNPDIFYRTSEIDAINKYWFELTTDTVSLAGLVRDSSLIDTAKYVSGLSMATSYYWRVKANNPLGWGPFSTWWKFTTVVGPPQAPVLSSPANMTIQQPANILFNWFKAIEITAKPNRLFITDEADVISKYWFEVTSDTVSNSDIIRDSTLTDTTKQLSFSGVSKTYFWRVKAKNAAGWSVFSGWWKFITIPSQNKWYLISGDVGSNCEGIFFIDPQTGWVCSSTNPGVVYKTVNGGSNWTSSNPPLITYMTPHDICFANSSSGQVVSGPSSGANYPWFESYDGGSNWMPFAMTNYYGSDTRSITYFNGSFWLVGTFTTLAPQQTSSSIYNGTVNFLYHTIPLNRIRAGKNYAWTVGNQGLVYRGLSSADIGDNTVNLTGVSFNDDNTGYVVGGNRVYKSTDNGGSWFRIYPLYDQASYNDVYFANKDTGWIACSLPGQGAIITTTNGGAAWTLDYIGPYAGADLTFVNNSTGWLLCGCSVLTNGSPQIASPILLSPANGATAVALTPALDWGDVIGAVKYRVQVSTDSLFSTVIIDDSTLAGSGFTIPAGILSNYTVYYWRAAAKNSTAWSPFASPWHFRTLGLPEQVILNSPPDNSSGLPIDISFNWFRAVQTLSKQNDNILNQNTRDGADAINSYWFELTTDTSTFAGIIRDTTLADTTKSVSGLSYETNYFWRVKAKNELGWGSFCSWWKFTTLTSAPAPPLLVSPMNNAVGQDLSLNLIWRKSGTALSYRVQVATDSLFAGLVVNDSTLTDSVKIISNLSPLTYYWWRVNAKNAGGTGGYSEVYKFRTIGYPNVVTLINPPNNAVNQPLTIQFVWSKASEQTSAFTEPLHPDLSQDRKPFIQDGLTENAQAIGSYWFDLVTDTVSLANLVRDTILTDTTKSVSGLSNLTNYYWRVKAKNQAGWGSYSVWYRFTTMISMPIAPQLISPPDNSTGQNLTLTFLWNKSLYASTYRIQVASDSLFSNLIVNDSTLTDTLKTVSGLSPLSYYWWRVNASNTAGTSSYSAVWKFKTLGLPLQVNLINPPNNSVNQPLSITFRWSRASEQTMSFWNLKQIDLGTDGSDNISNYWFELVTDTVSMANLLRDSTLADTTKSVSGLINLTNYYWRVKARNQIGWGGFCAWWKFTTILSAPFAPVLSSPPDNSVGQNLTVTLVWYKSPSASTYRVQVAADSLFTVLIVNDSTLTDSTRVVSGLNPLTSYWWRVNAKNPGGTSPYSSVWKFKTLGLPLQVNLSFPPNNSVDQPVSIQFSWNRASEQMNPFEDSQQRKSKRTEKISILDYRTDEIESITNYWFELVTDTVSMANMLRDTTLIDTTKLQSGLEYGTTYYWRVKAKNQIGWGLFSAWWKFTTLPGYASVSLKVIPGGFYNISTGQLNMRDTVNVFLLDSVTCSRIDSFKTILDSVTFSANIIFSNAQNGTYYLYVFHRNHLAISSLYKQNIIRGSTVSYDFTTDSSKAYGCNMIKVSESPVRWGMIPGDANADGYVDGLDQSIWILQNGSDGYLEPDFNGDTYVDGLDQDIWIIQNGQSYILPCEFVFEKFSEHQKKTKAIFNKEIEKIFAPNQNKK